MRTIEIGLMLPMGESFVDGSTARWAEIRELAVRAEGLGFDTVWVADELLWRPPDGDPRGWWECVAMTGAVAAATTRIKVGSWVLSALHRNPGITAKAVETIDEISGGRFVFGLGSGHAGRQAHAFGLPEDRVVGRFEEALEIIVALLRRGRADVEGTFHAARDLEHRPVGPRPGRIPLMIGAKGPKMLHLAARHADIWSWYVEERSDLTEFGPRLEALRAACLEAGRDPATIGRSAGIVVEPTPVTGASEVLGVPVRGTSEQIADAFRAFGDAGFTQLELILWPPTLAALEATALTGGVAVGPLAGEIPRRQPCERLAQRGRRHRRGIVGDGEQRRARLPALLRSGRPQALAHPLAQAGKGRKRGEDLQVRKLAVQVGGHLLDEEVAEGHALQPRLDLAEREKLLIALGEKRRNPQDRECQSAQPTAKCHRPNLPCHL